MFSILKGNTLGRTFVYGGTCAPELCSNRGTCESFKNDTTSTTKDLAQDQFSW